MRKAWLLGNHRGAVQRDSNWTSGHPLRRKSNGSCRDKKTCVGTRLPDDVRSIIVIQTAGIGDCLLTTPCLHALHRRFPDAVIDTVSRPQSREVFAANPHVTNAYCLDRTAESTLSNVKRVRSNRYQLMVDFHATPRTAWLALLGRVNLRLSFDRGRIGWRSFLYNIHGIEVSGYSAAGRLAMLMPLDVPDTDPTPCFPADESAINQAQKLLSSCGVENDDLLIALSPASQFDGKIWPHDKWIELSKRLSREWGAKVIAVASPDDHQQVRSMAEKSDGCLRVLVSGNLVRLAAIFGRAALVIADCSGPRHVAASQRTPTLTLHGSTNEIAWTHPAPIHGTVAGDMSCRPCQQSNCPLKTTECMQKLSVQAVLGAARHLLIDSRTCSYRSLIGS